MKAVVWHGKEAVRVDTVPDPRLEAPTDAIVRVTAWTDELLPLLDGGDPLGTADLVTHELPLERAPEAYDAFQQKRDGTIKVVLRPAAG